MDEGYQGGAPDLQTALDQFFAARDRKGGSDETDHGKTHTNSFMAALDLLLVKSLMIMGDRPEESGKAIVPVGDDRLPNILDDLTHEVVDTCAALISTLAPHDVDGKELAVGRNGALSEGYGPS